MATKNKGGRPRAVIDYTKLKSLCKIHCTGDECAAILDMDYETLNTALKRDGHGGFLDFFRKHSSGGKASLRRRQFRAAEDGNVTMQIWLGKQYLGQTDKQEIAGHTEKPLNVNVAMNAILGALDKKHKKDS